MSALFVIHLGNKNTELISDFQFNFVSLLYCQLDDCFLQEITIDKLAQVACLSKFAFIRLFKQSFGISPYQYLLHKRIIHAKTLLDKGKSVSDVAYPTSFADVPSFSKTFKKLIGVPPSQISQKATLFIFHKIR